MSASKTIRVLVVDDNPPVRKLLVEGLASLGEIIAVDDGTDALLKAIEAPPDLIIADYRLPGLDGRKLHEKLRTRETTRNIPFIFLASRGDIEEKLRPMVDGVEEFVSKPFFVKDLLRRAKVIVDRLKLERLQAKAARPGVIQGRLEEMGFADLMQSLEMGQKSCKLTLRRGDDVCEMYFVNGQCRHAKMGAVEGEDAVYPIVNWADGEFEIEFGATTTKTTIERSTTGLLMESMKMLDEANSQVEG